MKYLIVGSVVVLILWLLYRRVRPYIRLFQKLTEMTSTVLDESSRTSAKSLPKNKLVRCVQCGTWVPQGRAITLNSNLVYCSRECVEKVPTSQRKAAS